MRLDLANLRMATNKELMVTMAQIQSTCQTSQQIGPRMVPDRSLSATKLALICPARNTAWLLWIDWQMRAAVISVNPSSSVRIGTRLCSLWVDTMTSCRMRTSNKNLKPFKMKRLLTCITLMIHTTQLCPSNELLLTFKINTKLSRRKLSLVRETEWRHLVGKPLRLVEITILPRVTLLHLLPWILTIYQMSKLMQVPEKCRQLPDKMHFSV